LRRTAPALASLEDGYPVTSASPEWDAVIADLAAEIKTRHYSRKTLKTYAIGHASSSAF